MKTNNQLYLRSTQILLPIDKKIVEESNQNQCIYLKKTFTQQSQNQKDFKSKIIKQSFFGKNESCTVNNIMQQWDECNQSQQLMTGLSILRDQELLNDRNVIQQSLKGKNAVKFIYNDYHQKNTNAGYSRNNLGCFYTR